MLWSAVDKIAVQAGQFVIGIILARLLTPEDFGLIGMLSIFIAISQAFTDSGLEKGLIQKKDREEVDFSTVFIFNFVVSLLFYVMLFLAAPLIADFFEKPELVALTRVLTLIIVVDSLAIVQRARLSIDIDFKTFAKVRVASVVIGGILGIYYAYQGYGVWALVIQTLSATIVSAITLWYFSRWKPSFSFSKKSFKQLFGFGSKILLSGLYSKTIANIYHIAIGKAYSATELGFYTNSKKYAEVASATVTSILNQVTFPILAHLQDDKQKLVSVYSRLVRMATFIIFPVMTIFALLADPFIRIVLTDPWLPVIPLLQLMCFATVFYPVSVINLNILNAVGRSDLFLKVNLSKSPVLILALIITIPLGVKAIVIGHIVTSCISFFINTYYPGKMFDYGPVKHLKDMAPFFIATSVMALVVFFAILFIENIYLQLIIGGSIGLVVYLGMCSLLKLSEMNELKDMAMKIVR